MEIIRNAAIDRLVNVLLDSRCISHLEYLHTMLGAGFQAKGSDGTWYVLTKMLSDDKSDKLDTAMLINTCVMITQELITSVNTALDQIEDKDAAQ